MRRLWNKKAQSTMEYAIVMGLVLGAVIAMQTFVKRGMTGKATLAVDNLSLATGGTTGQYEPYYARHTFTSDVAGHSIEEETTEGGGFAKYMGHGGRGRERTTTRRGASGVRSWTAAD